MKIILDTSALISLAAGGILENTITSVHCVVPSRVKHELLGLSKRHDFEGKLARETLDFIDIHIEVADPSTSSSEGEMECAYLANDLSDVEFLITDDIKCIRKLERITPKSIRFSTIIIYALCLHGKLTKKQARETLERMRVKRNWKDNVIFEQALILVDELSCDGQTNK